MLTGKLLDKVVKLQRGEITEKEIYYRISKYIKNNENRGTLLRIADEEQRHYDIWKKHTGVEVKPAMAMVFYYVFLARILGYTFVIKRMEKRQNQFDYNDVFDEEMKAEVPEINSIVEQELVHEQMLISLLDEELLHYVGSMVLGLNDALVEFTGSLAGYSFAMQSNRLITLAGLITGVSATLSMASSEFLSSRAEGNSNAGKSASFTGVSYLITVILLLLPFLLLPDKLYGVAVVIMLAIAVAIIGLFNFYISVAQDLNFKERFSEMLVISLSVSGISFLIGVVVKHFLHVEL